MKIIRYVGLNVHKATVAVAVVSYRTSVVAETSTAVFLCISDSRRPGRGGLVFSQCSLQSRELFDRSVETSMRLRDYPNLLVIPTGYS